jgi:NitT/TauT family transport system substrate-binding protein
MNRIIAEAKWMIAILAVFLVLAGIFGCTGNVGKSTPDRYEKITIAVTPWPASASIYVAQDKGYFQDEGLETTLRPYISGHLGLADLLSGKVDLAAAGDTPIARAVVEGRPVAVVATVSEIDRAILIVARKDRGVSKIDDLRGKKIGVVEGTTADFFLNVFLATSYIDENDVQVVNVAADKLVDALLNGDVDAAATWSPHTLVLLDKLGSDATILEDPTIYTMTWNIAVTRGFAREKARNIKKFLRAIIRANSFIGQHPDEVRTISAKHIGTDSPLYEGEWKDYHFAAVLDQSLILNLEDQARWMARREGDGERSMPNFLNFVSSASLKAVQPGAVSIAGK